MRLLLFVLFAINILNANINIFDKFRTGNPWQKDVDKYLYSDEYINYLLKNKNVKFGYYDNPTNIIVCYKEKKVLDVYSFNDNLKLRHRFTNILTGKNFGNKWKEGDGKTPIGVYTLKYKLDDNNLNDFYGPLAYPTNYPNLYDSYLGKSGHGIWIHGFPKDNPNRDFNTKGCIALPNKELIKLSKMIDYKNAILIIDTDNLPTTDKKTVNILLKEIFKWRYAWKYNNLDTYLSFYDKKDFKKENKYGFQTFSRLKKTIFKRQKHKILKFRDLKIIPYPSKDNNIYKISFYEIFKANGHSFEGNKVLYVKLINNKMKIFLEN
jgi:murein L,D-transpeptidase YafK